MIWDKHHARESHQGLLRVGECFVRNSEHGRWVNETPHARRSGLYAGDSVQYLCVLNLPLTKKSRRVGILLEGEEKFEA